MGMRLLLGRSDTVVRRERLVRSDREDEGRRSEVLSPSPSSVLASLRFVAISLAERCADYIIEARCAISVRHGGGMNEGVKQRRMSGWLVASSLFASMASGACNAAPGHGHAGAPPEKLGTVHFETSCAPEVAQRFDRAMALLHSFEFPEAIEAFRGVLKDDARCVIADWGIALSLWDNPFAGHRTPKTLRDGFAAVQEGLKAGAKTARAEVSCRSGGSSLLRAGAGSNCSARRQDVRQAIAGCGHPGKGRPATAGAPRRLPLSDPHLRCAALGPKGA